MAGLASCTLSLLHILVILAAAGCKYVDNSDVAKRGPGKAPKKAGIYHVVKKGENLYRIGKAYGMDHITLARTNRVDDARDIQIGRRLFIPDATRQLPVAIITPIKEPVPSRAGAAPGTAPAATAPAGKTPSGKIVPTTTPGAMAASKTTARAKTASGKSPRARAAAPASRGRKRPSGKSSKRGFVWPVRGKITARFDPRHDSLNDGIDIAAPSGTQVRATLAGQVIYSDHLRGYGNLIIVRHRGGFASVYAHNRRNLVRQGQKVSRQQVIAEVGTTGRVTTPHLHFEIRRNNVARDPLSYLP